jgi:hypothetical protein
MRRGATFDDSGAYRYALWRRWQPGGLRVAFVMLNPSTADSSIDDPTIRRCIGFAKDWGYHALTVVNLFGFRTPSPRELAAASDPIGADNDRYLVRAAREASEVVVAWGIHGALRGRAATVVPMLERVATDKLVCLGRTLGGHPRHPLYLRKTASRLLMCCTPDGTPRLGPHSTAQGCFRCGPLHTRLRA